MLSMLTTAILYCRKRKLIVALVVVGTLLAYTVCYQLLTPRFLRHQESKVQATLSKDLQTTASFDLPAENAAVRIPAALPSSPSQGSLGQVTRKIIRNGSFALAVKSFEPFFAELRSQTDLHGGFVAQVQANRGAGSVSAAQIVVRILPDSVDAFTAWLRDQGTLTSEHLTSEDISEQYFDLSARLQNARHFETRLLEMLRTQTGKLQDLVLVEEKLNQVREQIEQFEGKIRLYDNLTGLATLTLSVRVEEHYVVSHPPNFVELVRSTWRTSTRALRESLELLALACVAITPWIPPLCILGLSLWLGQKRLLSGLRKKQAA